MRSSYDIECSHQYAKEIMKKLCKTYDDQIKVVSVAVQAKDKDCPIEEWIDNVTAMECNICDLENTLLGRIEVEENLLMRKLVILLVDFNREIQRVLKCLDGDTMFNWKFQLDDMRAYLWQAKGLLHQLKNRNSHYEKYKSYPIKNNAMITNCKWCYE